ncbi:MAG TPA: succinate dehydrogenase [Alphaproteobacteria bacterium]
MSAGHAHLAWRARAHPNYAAFVVHRLSGLLLALFLPFHFWALGQAIRGEAALDGFLRWTEHPLLKLAETGLVMLLTAHLAGGLRLLAIEFAGWRDWQRTAVAATAGFSLAVGLLFLLNVTGP